jgi:signal peptidase I
MLLALMLAGCSSLSGAAECQDFTIPNAAMSPTYNAGQLVNIDTQAYASAKPRRGQVVIVKEPGNHGQEEALRVIGLPGETVRLTETQTFINGTLLSEPFVLHRGTQQPMEVTLGANQYFLMGDNRPQSTDSRAWGAVPLSEIIAEIGTQNCPND